MQLEPVRTQHKPCSGPYGEKAQMSFGDQSIESPKVVHVPS